MSLRWFQLLQLLLKASQDKKFVCEEADRALNSMVASLTPLPLLHKLRAYVKHSNLRVRAKAAVSISTCVSKMVKLSLLLITRGRSFRLGQSQPRTIHIHDDGSLW